MPAPNFFNKNVVVYCSKEYLQKLEAAKAKVDGLIMTVCQAIIFGKHSGCSLTENQIHLMLSPLLRYQHSFRTEVIEMDRLNRRLEMLELLEEHLNPELPQEQSIALVPQWGAGYCSQQSCDSKRLPLP